MWSAFKAKPILPTTHNQKIQNKKQKQKQKQMLAISFLNSINCHKACHPITFEIPACFTHKQQKQQKHQKERIHNISLYDILRTVVAERNESTSSLSTSTTQKSAHSSAALTNFYDDFDFGVEFEPYRSKQSDLACVVNSGLTDAFKIIRDLKPAWKTTNARKWSTYTNAEIDILDVGHDISAATFMGICAAKCIHAAIIFRDVYIEHNPEGDDHENDFDEHNNEHDNEHDNEHEDHATKNKLFIQVLPRRNIYARSRYSLVSSIDSKLIKVGSFKTPMVILSRSDVLTCCDQLGLPTTILTTGETMTKSAMVVLIKEYLNEFATLGRGRGR